MAFAVRELYLSRWRGRERSREPAGRSRWRNRCERLALLPPSLVVFAVRVADGVAVGIAVGCWRLRLALPFDLLLALLVAMLLVLALLSVACVRALYQAASGALCCLVCFRIS